MEGAKHVLVYGGAGQLGATVAKDFKDKGWVTHCIDFCKNDESDNNVVLSPSESTKENVAKVVHDLKEKRVALDAVVCVAGGWLGGSAHLRRGRPDVDLQRPVLHRLCPHRHEFLEGRRPVGPHRRECRPASHSHDDRLRHHQSGDPSSERQPGGSFRWPSQGRRGGWHLAHLSRHSDESQVDGSGKL